MTTAYNDQSDQPMLYRFVAVHSAIKRVQETRFESPIDRQTALLHTINDLRLLDQAIDQSDMFSPNDMIEDVQTPNLKYLLIPFVFGEFLLNSSFGYDNRPNQLKEVNLIFGKFIDRLDLLFLVTQEQRKLINGAQLDPGSARTRKIADFQREKKLMPKLKEYHEKWAKIVQKECKDITIGSNLITTNALTHATKIEKSTIEQDGESDVDSIEREILLEVLNWCIDKVISLKKSIKEEEEILKHHKFQMEQREHELKHGKPMNSTQTNGSGQDGSIRSQLSSISENNAISGGGVELDSAKDRPIRPGQYVLASSENSNGPPRPVYNMNPTVSLSGVSTGGLHVHQLNSSDDTKKEIPEHMKNYLTKPKPPQDNNKQSQQQQQQQSKQELTMMQMQGLGPSAGPIGRGVDVRQHQEHCPKHPHQVKLREKGKNMQDVMTDEERLAKPWFNGSMGDDCECDNWQDVTLMPDYVMSSATRGGRGKLVKLCPVHKIGADVCGCDQSSDLSKKDFINDAVALRTDRTRVFRDRNPYLMEIGDFADMKIAAGELPGIKDRLLADRIARDEERHRLRVENGESDEEESLLTQKEIDDIDDAETMKKRQWDDWADDNQKGAGNKNYRK